MGDLWVLLLCFSFFILFCFFKKFDFYGGLVIGVRKCEEGLGEWGGN